MVALVKTIRVAYIFFRVTPTKKVKIKTTHYDVNSYLIKLLFYQKVQDWHLLLLSAGIILIEVIFTIPLLTLTFVNGDARLIRDSENPTFINVSKFTFYFFFGLF